MSRGKNSGIPEDEYEVEDILDYRIIPAYDPKSKRYYQIIEYKIKWLGYEETTWEPEANLEHCQIILSNFIKRIVKKKNEDEKGKITGSIKDSLLPAPEEDFNTLFESVPISPKSFGSYSSECISQKSAYNKKRSKIYPKANKKETHKKNKSLVGRNVSQKNPNSRRNISPILKIQNAQMENKDYFSSNEQKERKKSYKKKQNVPYICYKDLKNLPSFNKFCPSFEEIMYIDASVKKKPISEINDCEELIDATDEFNNLKKGKICKNIINNNIFSNGDSKIDSVEIIKVNKPSSILQKNVSVKARFNIKEKPGLVNEYLNEHEDEKLKQHYEDVFRKYFEGISLKHK